jgi:acyl-CoA dehydrogenase
VDRIVVAAAVDEADGELGLWLVDPSSSGVTLTRTPTLDATTRTSTLSLTDAAAERLPGADSRVVADLVARATVLAANDLVGIAREALTRTVAHLRTREQFGKPVGSFQALKHHLADLLVALTMAEHAGWYAAHALDAGLPDAAVAVSVAKAKTSDVARLATARMIQYHGGIGYTWEHETHFFFKRARRLEQTYGDAAQHRNRIAQLVLS